MVFFIVEVFGEKELKHSTNDEANERKNGAIHCVSLKHNVTHTANPAVYIDC